MDNEVQVEHQQDIMDKISERENPILIVKGTTYTTGTAVKLVDLITKASVYEDDDVTKIDAKQQVVITCESESYDAKTRTLILETPGVYTVKYYLRDSYGLSVTKLIKIVAVDRAIDITE